jgi:hypothetical protein
VIHGERCEGDYFRLRDRTNPEVAAYEDALIIPGSVRQENVANNRHSREE